MRHQGRVALITGAASGIGRAIAFRLAQDGARLALLDRNPEVMATADKAGQAGCAFVVDVADTSAVESAIREVEAKIGPVDVLVNGAAIVDHIAPLAKMKPERWRDEIGVNLSGPFNTIRVVAPGMAARKWGRIVNIS
ncbi:MAG: SDR family NAD(P)-dependent oxidoreductase, partial [Alphaproteobacteria bacterium]|nr:SDR family NAD(P)-dependent oxidoreductase [Alphaproteobacteria bacterium]